MTKVDCYNATFLREVLAHKVISLPPASYCVISIANGIGFLGEFDDYSLEDVEALYDFGKSILSLGGNIASGNFVGAAEDIIDIG